MDDLTDFTPALAKARSEMLATCRMYILLSAGLGADHADQADLVYEEAKRMVELSADAEMKAVRTRTLERMQKLGIPQGTDDPLLVSLGARPLARAELMSDESVAEIPAGWRWCPDCDGEGVITRDVAYGPNIESESEDCHRCATTNGIVPDEEVEMLAARRLALSAGLGADHADVVHDEAPSGVDLIAAERRRQIAAVAGLPGAGSCDDAPGHSPPGWPWAWWWKPSTEIRDLVKAGALIAAEIDRLQRETGRS